MCCGGQGCSGVPLRSLHSKEQKHLSGAVRYTVFPSQGWLKKIFLRR